MRRFFCTFGALALLVCLTAALGWSQAVTASSSLTGTVTDQTGAVVVGAEISASQRDTGLARTTATTETGSYRFDALPPGSYSVKVTKAGFAAQTTNGTELIVSRTTTQNFTLKPGSESQTVEVTAEAPLLDQQQTSVGVNITPTQVESLPLNGRDFGNLAYLAPGVKPVNPYDPTKQRYATFGVNGSNGRNVNMTVNGIDNKDGTVGGPVMQLPLEAVQEFNISTQRFSAVNGRSEGAAINVITKAGTNNYHGSLYMFDTETALNHNDYFDVKAGNPTPNFSRQQFGGSVGGPVRKDGDFLFFAWERLRERTAIGVTQTAFSELSLMNNLNLGNVTLSPQPATSIPTPYDDTRYTGRWDHRFNQSNNFFITYSAQNNTGLDDQSGQTNDLSAGNFTNNHLIIANATLNTVFTPRLVNAFTFGHQYWNNLIDSHTRAPNYGFPNEYFGTNGNVPQQSFQRRWQFKDDMSYTKGNHGLKWGVDYLWEPTLGGYFEFNPTLTLGFFDDPDVILGNKNGLYPQGFHTPGAVASMALAGGDPKFDLAGKMLGFYFQDDWKVTSRLSLNLGLRYDHDLGLYGEQFQALSRTYLALKAIGSPFAGVPHEDNLDFSPRFGFAWDVAGTGHHLIRGGFGLYYGQTFENIPLFMMQQANPTVFATLFSFSHSGVTASCPAATCAIPGTNIPLSSWRLGIDPLPTPPGALSNLPNGSTGRLMDPHYRNPVSEQANLGYAWQLTPNDVIELDYVHELGVHEPKTINLNPADPATGLRILQSTFKAAGVPQLGSISNNESIARSRYDGANLSYRRRLTHRFSVNTVYTLSRAVGYQGSSANFGNTAVIPTAPFRPQDFGPVPNDERHRWVTSAVVTLPWGFQVSPIVQLASARPYNATEGISDVLGLASGNGAFHAIGLASDPLHTLLQTKSMTAAQLRSCLSSGGCTEVHFDTLRGQKFFQFDTRVGKSIKFGERSNLNLFFQGFDITNRANFGNTFSGNIRSALFGTPTGFITPGGTIVPKAFRAEFGGRFTF